MRVGEGPRPKFARWEGGGLNTSSIPDTGFGRDEADVRLSDKVVLKPFQKMCDARRLRGYVHIIEKGPHTLAWVQLSLN